MRIKPKPGQRVLTAATALASGAAAAGGSTIYWYSTLGVVSKIGLALGIGVSLPVANIAGLGLGAAILGAKLVNRQMAKEDNDWAKAMLRAHKRPTQKRNVPAVSVAA